MNTDWALRLARLQAMTERTMVEHEDWEELLQLVHDLGQDYIALKAEIVQALRDIQDETNRDR